jgi:hypothetical protein
MRIPSSLAFGILVLAVLMALIPIPVSGIQGKPAADQDPLPKSEWLASDAGAKTYYGPAILQLAQDLEDFYVFPSVGARYAAMLCRNLEMGLYRGISDPAEISKRLNADLKAISEDLHLRVRPVQPALVAHALSPPNAVEGAKWIAPGVAYIRFNLFPGTPETIAATEKFMREHVTARAIIIDGRENHGGGADEINVMLPYFYALPTKLMEMEASEKVVKAQGFPVSEDAFFHQVKSPPGMVRFEHVINPNPSEHRLFKAKVFYLTSIAGTGSAGEVLAFALKLTHRGTLVESTLAAWTISVIFCPSARAWKFSYPWAERSTQRQEPIGKELEYFPTCRRQLIKRSM